MDIDFKKFITLKNGLIAGGVVVLVGIFIFSIVYSQKLENRFVNYSRAYYNDINLDNDVEKLIILNGVGNVNVVQSDNVDTPQIKATVLYDEDLKRDEARVGELVFDVVDVEKRNPKDDDPKTVVVSPKLTDDSYYFSYLDDENLASHVQINYEVIVPNNLEKIDIYNPMGDISIYGVNSSINAKTYKGNISIKDVSPRDFVIAQTYQGQIDMNFDDLGTTTYIGASVNDGDVYVDIQDVNYKEDNSSPKILGMDNDMFELNEYEDVVEEFVEQDSYNNKKLEIAIKSKKGESQITTTVQ